MTYRSRGDRRVHGHTPEGAEIVRYDVDGRWYIEDDLYRVQVRLAEAAAEALMGRAYLGLPGGSRFDFLIREGRGELTATQTFHTRRRGKRSRKKEPVG